MRTNRRSILAMIGMAPAAATLDAGNAIGGLSGDLGMPQPQPYYGLTSSPLVHDSVEKNAWIKALLDPDRAHTLRMLAKDQVGTITILDPDIAAKRSWSMSVKIAEQRRRYIERRLMNEIEEGSWSKMRKIVGF